MLVKSFIHSFIKTALIFAVVCVAAFGGYQYGTEKTKEQCGQAFEVAFVDQALRESTEARHDRGIAELLNQKRIDDAFMLSQTRYFSRILSLPELAKTSENPVLQRDIKAELIEAKALAIKTAFKFDNERDSKKWEVLVRTVPEPKKDISAGNSVEQKSTPVTTLKSQ